MDEQTLEQPSAEPETSLADHEASYGPGADRAERPAEPPPDPAPDPEPKPAAADGLERDDTGKFKPRHRAKSQQASPEDVPRIQELTRRMRDAELRAEAAERRAAQPPEPRREPDPTPQPRRAPAFPTFEEFVAIKGNEDADWYAYSDERTRWQYAQMRSAERAQQAYHDEVRTVSEHLDKYRDELESVTKESPDFDDAIAAVPSSGPYSVSKVMERAAIEAGPRAAYWLATHHEDRAGLTRDTLLDEHGQPLIPGHPAFKATVAATRRYLASLVAPEQRPSSSSRTAAGSTGAALALVPSSVPKPPTPVRTGAIKDAAALPSDESSLAEHERAFHPKRSRA